MSNETTSKEAEQEVVDSYAAQYVLAEGYHIHSINGCYGGMNAQGDIVANFYFEQPAFPEEITVSVMPNGTGREEYKGTREAKALRFVPMGVAMNPGTARSIAQWLNKKADEVERKFSEKEVEE